MVVGSTTVMRSVQQLLCTRVALYSELSRKRSATYACDPSKAEACGTLQRVSGPPCRDTQKNGDAGRRPELMGELNDGDLLADGETEPGRARPHRWTREEAREAARLSREARATRRHAEPPSDADIERGLRERAVSDPRA